MASSNAAKKGIDYFVAGVICSNGTGDKLKTAWEGAGYLGLVAGIEELIPRGDCRNSVLAVMVRRMPRPDSDVLALVVEELQGFEDWKLQRALEEEGWITA